MKLGDKNKFRHPMCLKNGHQMKFWGENEWGYGDRKYHHLLFPVVTKQLFRHTMRMEFGDKDIFRHPMSLKNRRQMKFWWEIEIDYGDKKHRHPLFAAVTKQIFCHSICLKLGDESILRHLMCLKNRCQMKFWWEKE